MPDLETLHAVAAMDNFLTRRMNALEQREAALQLSCEHIIQRLITLDHQFTESIGLIRKRLALHDQYLEQNHTFFNIFEENSKLKNEIRQLEKILEEQVSCEPLYPCIACIGLPDMFGVNIGACEIKFKRIYT